MPGAKADPASPAANAALFAHARRALAAGRKESAASLARAAARAMPGWGSSLQLAGLLSGAGYYAEARTVLAPLATQDRDAVSIALADVALREGRLEEAASLLQSHLAAHPGDRHVHYTLASVLPHLGLFDQANRHAARGTLVTCGDLQLTSSRVIRFPESPPAIPMAPPFNRVVRHEPALATGAEAVYFVGCDSRYFLLFGEALATSLVRRAGAPLALHLHLVNPNPAAEALLERLRTKPVLPIVCSRESVDLSALGERQRRTYLSCARYLVLPELLERYAKPMLVADADQLVVADLRPLLRDLAEHDIGLLRNDRMIHNILALVSASVLGVNDSRDGRRFVRTLRDTISERMADPAGLSWHLDQASLAVTHLWHSEIRTLPLPEWIMDSTIDPTAAPDSLLPRALFWSITLSHTHTVRKLQTSLFRQFLGPEPASAR
jgi:tetratricopeptide (TPR) repeat protein